MSSQDIDPDYVLKSYNISEQIYSHGYALRQKHSSINQCATDWFISNSSILIKSEAPRILSLGCGSGVFDLGLMNSVFKKLDHYDFTGVDFNHSDLQVFQNKIDNLSFSDETTINLKCMKFDYTTQLDGTYDLISMVHFLHAFEDVGPVIQNALKMLSGDGVLLIVQTGEQGVWSVKKQFLDVLDHANFQSFETIEKRLASCNISYETSSLNTCFDVSIMSEMSTDVIALMSFCLGNDLTQYSSDVQDAIRKAFLSVAAKREDGSLVIDESMAAIVCRV